MKAIGFGAGIASCVILAAAQLLPVHKAPDIEYVPTSRPAVLAMLQLAKVTKNDVVYDLGCGDGRILIAAAKEFGARGVGVDINPTLLDRARRNAREAGVDSLVRFEQRDLFETDLRGATVVTLYLLTSINLKLRPKLLAELRPGARVVSNTFAMGGWKPDRQITVGGRQGRNPFLNPKIFLWTIRRSPVAN